MSVKLITYELTGPREEYTSLYEAIELLGTRSWHYLESTWLVQTAQSVDAIVVQLRDEIGESDRLLVVDITGDHCQGWLPVDAWEWIKTYV